MGYSRTETVGLYCRISKDRSGRRESVEAQERWGREYAARCWPGARVRVFADNSISAAGDDERPGYDELRVAVRAGEITELWAVEQSRLERREGPWFELAAELDDAGITELHTNRDGIVRVRDDVAGIKAVINAGEVRRLRRRLNDKLDELAAEGRPRGGQAFGYRPGVDEQGRKTLVIEPSEAESIRSAADAVLSGWSLTSVGAELRRRGHRGARGGRLGPSTIRQMLTSPTIAGMRQHRGQIVGRGCWEPIITEDTRQLVKAKLAAPRVVQMAADRPDGRRHGGPRNGGSYTVTQNALSKHAGRKYALTGGLSVCGVCGKPMGGTVKTSPSGKRRPYLVCAPSAGGRSCVGILLEPTEHHVADRLFTELDRPEFLAAVGADDHAERRDELTHELAVVDQQRAELAKMWSTRELSTVEWQAARSGLDQQEYELRAELGATPAPPARVDIIGAREAWPAMTLDEKRELLRMFIEKVVINRATPGTRAFDPGRVEIEWRRI
jgi:DNA invertase Pin-like site-specific DNA recombinase